MSHHDSPSTPHTMNEIRGFAWFKIHAGKIGDFKRLTAACMESARTKDTGTLQYEVFLNEDETEAVVYERYRDSEALIEHGANLGETATAIMATGDVSGVILGRPSEDLSAALEGGSVEAFRPFMSL